MGRVVGFRFHKHAWDDHRLGYTSTSDIVTTTRKPPATWQYVAYLEMSSQDHIKLGAYGLRHHTGSIGLLLLL